METLGVFLMVVGGGVCVSGGLWLLVVAFRESPLWGLACLLMPLAAFVFLFTHYDRAARPFGVSLLGSGIAFIGSLVTPITPTF